MVVLKEDFSDSRLFGGVQMTSGRMDRRLVGVWRLASWQQVRLNYKVGPTPNGGGRADVRLPG
jgi:hypothetical protein